MRKIISQHLFRRSFTISIMAYRFFFIFKESDLSQLWEERGHESLEMEIEDQGCQLPVNLRSQVCWAIEVMT